MNPENDPNLQSTADRNVEQLLSHAYRPESPDPIFAEQVTEALVRRAAKHSEKSTRPKPPVWRTKLVGFGIAAGVVIASGLFAILFFHHRVALPVAQNDRERITPSNQFTESVKSNQPLPQPAEKSDWIVPAHRLPDPPVATISPGQSIETQAGQRRRVELVDGSHLFIDQSTRLTVDAPRAITVSSGQVFVEVSPRDANDPFIVHTPKREVRAVGTHFGVRVGQAGTGVVVTQGKVRVDGVPEAIVSGEQLLPVAMPGIQPAPAVASVLEWTRDLVTASQLPLVPPSVYTGGAVVVADSSGRESRLSLRHYHVDVHIEDGFARTTIDQTYFNHETIRAEGTFYFPLPADASISRLAMYVDGKRMEGGMAEREYARQTYESIVRTQRDPALLEWVDGTTFKMRVFPLEPRQEKRIILSYVQRLPASYGKWNYRFPAGNSLGGSGDFAFHAVVKGGAGKRWACASHDLFARIDSGDLILDAHEAEVALDRDVVLEGWDTTASADPSRAVPPATTQPRAQFAEASLDGNRYLMVRYQPALQAEPRRERRDWVFLFESAANRTPLLARAQVDVIAGLLARAEHDDTFQIITAETRPQTLTAGRTLATPDNIRAAVASLEKTHLVGALDLAAALDMASSLAQGSKNPWIVHVGSAVATLGERRSNLLAARIPADARYVGIGVGRQWNRGFMKAAADRTGGYLTQINPDESIPWRTLEVSSAFNTPRLIGIQARDEAGRTAFLVCDDSVSGGQPVCAVSRLEPRSDLPKTITLSGTLDGKPWSQVLAVADVAKNAGYIPRLWAKLEIDRLLAADPTSNHAKIVELSKAMYVMSPFTSLLVLENDAMYAKFNVDRGRKDHWAMYPCPENIQVTEEPLAASRNDAPGPAPLPVPTQPNKPTPADILQTIVTRPSIRAQDARIGDAAYGRNTWTRASDGSTITRVYDVRDMIFNLPDFNDAPDFSLSTGQSSTVSAAPGPTTEQRALEELKATARLQEIQRQQDEYDSQQKTRQATAVESTNLDQARQLYSQAVSLDPDNATAKAGLSRVLILQARSAENISVLDQQSKRIQTQIQELTYQFDQAVADARDAIARRDFQAASTDLQRAQVARLQNPNIFTPEALNDFNNQIRQTQLALDTARQEAIDVANSNNQNETANRLMVEQASQENQRARTVKDLRAAAMRLTEEARFREAIGVVDQITVLDPTNEYAIGVRPLLEDKFNFQQQRLFMQNKDVNFTRRLNTTEAETIPYDDILRYPADWPDISQTRDQTVQPERGEHQEFRAVEAQLDRPLPELTFDAIAFDDVIDFLRDVTAANIFVNWKSLETARIHRDAPVSLKLHNVKFSEALHQILVAVGGSVQLGYRIESNVIDIATEADLRRGELLTRVYDVRDVLRAGPPHFTDAPDFALTATTQPAALGSSSSGGLFQSLPISGQTRQDQVDRVIRLITGAVAPDSWRDAGGELGSIKELSGQLIITQTPENQRQIVFLLDQIRQEQVVADDFSTPAKQARAMALAASMPAGAGDHRRLLYRRPSYRPDSELFSDLLQWAPGMNTSEEDRAATIERESGPIEHAEVGAIDPGARRLIERARQVGWQRVTVPASAGSDTFDIIFDGAGRYVFERRIGLGLQERTVCDGVTLLQCYPEIGVGARREVSRFHRAKLEAFIPWALPPVEDLARGADLKAIDAQTVAVVPRRATTAALATTMPSPKPASSAKASWQVRLVFAPDGRLAARQIVDISTGKSVYRQEYDAQGRVTYVEPGVAANRVVDLKLSPADPPDLGRHDEKLVILPMPLRTPQAAATPDLGRKAYADWPEDEALKVIAANVAARNEEAAITIAWRFFQHGDRRLGFHVLMMAGGLNWEQWGSAHRGVLDTPANELAFEQSNPPLAAYLKWRQAEIRNNGQDRIASAPLAAVSDSIFFYRLVEFHEIADAWKSDRAKEPTVEEFRRAIEFARDCPDIECAWRVFSLIAGYPATAEDARALAAVAQRFTDIPAFSYAAGYERARALFRAGDTAAAQRIFEQTYFAAIDRGDLPPIDADFRCAMEAPSAGTKVDGAAPSGWGKLIRDAFDRVVHRTGSRAALAVAWQCWQLGDAALSDELLARTLTGSISSDRDAPVLAAIEFLSRTDRPARAESMLSSLLEQKPWSQFPELWRLDAALAGRAKHPARALAAFERAIELEFAANPNGSDLSAIRSDYGQLLNGYALQAQAAAQLGQSPPEGLAEKVTRAADRWRSLDPDSGAPSRLAGETLRILGKKDQAWEYLTIPFSAHPAEAKPWKDLARTLRAQGETDLASRAYAAACDANPADAQAIWDRAEFLEEAGQPAAANTLYSQIANGDWDIQFESLKQSARGRVR